jgi:hypothetical protein
MLAKVDYSGSLENLQKIAWDLTNKPNIKALGIFACDDNGFEPTTLDPLLQSLPVPLFGGIFPALLHGNQKLDHGTIVMGFNEPIDVHTIPCLSKSDTDFDKLITNKKGDIAAAKTLMVFVDGFSRRIGAFIESLFNICGLDTNYLGGGTGSLSMVQKPSILTSRGLMEDAAILVGCDIESGIGVSHGWHPISGPYKVTEAENNTIRTLEWQPAFDVYRRAVETHADVSFEKMEFFDIAKAYPFGIAKLQTEWIVRDPFMKGDDDSLICVGEVREGGYVDILNGDIESLIQAAKTAYMKGMRAYQGPDNQCMTFFVDCISRVLFLQDRFAEELAAVNNGPYPLVGMCSIGEIANNSHDYLEFYNKTAVVGILEA